MVSLLLWLAGSLSAWGVNAPWIHFDSLLKNTIGANPCVQVGDFDSQTSSIEIKTCDAAMAESLAVILKSSYENGRVTVKVSVLDPSGHTMSPFEKTSSASATKDERIDAIRAHFAEGLQNNKYFLNVYAGREFEPLYVEVKKEIIQFWDDNMGDRYGNSNYTAEEAFNQVLNLNYDGSINVALTTSKSPD